MSEPLLLSALRSQHWENTVNGTMIQYFHWYTKADVALWSGLVFGITFLIAGIMAPIWGKIADNKGKKRMALRAGFAIAICYVLIGLVTDQYQLLMGRALVGFANGFYPAAMTMVSRSA